MTDMAVASALAHEDPPVALQDRHDLANLLGHGWPEGASVHLSPRRPYNPSRDLHQPVLVVEELSIRQKRSISATLIVAYVLQSRA